MLALCRENPALAEPIVPGLSYIKAEVVYAARAEMARSVDDVYGPGALHDVLTERACALGGERVTPIGMCSNGQLVAIDFGVYVPL